ncbi:MAG: TauD/TfdA family dioxygenase [Planctomycetota bacterium]|nr:TauD/TfdA family dioxygenase [Planctomycetota bacterium]MDA1213238.1 TauD/TfdA family dioxygenase [Planctomycetota bacterium]
MISTSVHVEHVRIPGQQDIAGQVFPLVLRCTTISPAWDAIDAWIGTHRDELSQQASEYGAILFRDFPLTTPEDFDAFIAAFEFENFPYEESLSNAVRVNKTPRVFTANEAPADVKIFLHHEMAQTPIYPSKLMFFCEQPAEIGGATPLCRSDLLWEKLAEKYPEFAANCREKGLKYSNVMPPENDPASGMGRSWKSTLRAETKSDAERRLGNIGYSWEWEDGDCLRATTPVLPAVYRLPDGRETFFNQLIAAHQGWKDLRNDPSRSITFGDGTFLDDEAVRYAAQIGDELSYPVPWQRGDVALIDNFVTMHGRQVFTGTRKVLASLIK